MFILHLLPDEFLQLIVHLILVLGITSTILSYFLHFIPGIYQYRIPIKILSTILLTAGVYFEGGYSTELSWRQRVLEVEEKVAIAEARAEQANYQMKTVIVEKIKIVKQKVLINNTDIQQHKETINAECKLSDLTFKIYNNSVTNNGNAND